jgi:hypothetical protein
MEKQHSDQENLIFIVRLPAIRGGQTGGRSAGCVGDCISHFITFHEVVCLGRHAHLTSEELGFAVGRGEAR